MANESLSTFKQAEENFDNKSPSMLAANYHEVKINDMLPTHLNHMQLWIWLATVVYICCS
jgi:hypothetical protein